MNYRTHPFWISLKSIHGLIALGLAIVSLIGTVLCFTESLGLIWFAILLLGVAFLFLCLAVHTTWSQIRAPSVPIAKDDPKSITKELGYWEYGGVYWRVWTTLNASRAKNMPIQQIADAIEIENKHYCEKCETAMEIEYPMNYDLLASAGAPSYTVTCSNPACQRKMTIDADPGVYFNRVREAARGDYRKRLKDATGYKVFLRQIT